MGLNLIFVVLFVLILLDFNSVFWFYLCFLDYSKTCDCVNWRLLWDVLSQMGTLRHLIQLLKALYNTNVALMKGDGRTPEAFNVFCHPYCLTSMEHIS